eukprot:2514536-Prymnesium_polylepis.1
MWSMRPWPPIERRRRRRGNHQGALEGGLARQVPPGYPAGGGPRSSGVKSHYVTLPPLRWTPSSDCRA